MKKNSTRLLSLLLVLTMFLSLGTTAFAAEPEIVAEPEESADSSWGDWSDWADESEEASPVEEEEVAEEPAEAEEPVAEEEPAPVEEVVAEEEPVEVAYPANTFFYVGGSGLRVTVEAPEGAFPIDAQMNVTEIRPEAVQDKVANAGVEGNVVVAADITFQNAAGEELQPKENVEVSITASVPNVQSLKVVHIGDDDTVEEVNQLPDSGVTISVADAPAMESVADVRTMKFEAKSFSVYAVVGEDVTAPESRAKVSFISNGTTVETVYVKNSDTADELKSIVYDPGTGTLNEGEVFLGWTTVPVASQTSETVGKTIPQIRTELAALEDIAEGDEINYYALICRIYTVTYLDEDKAAIGTVSVKLFGEEEQGDVTLNQEYEPGDGAHAFEGWIVNEGKSNIVSATGDGEGTVDKPYVKGTVLTIKGNVTLGVDAPAGHWLVFDENGKGATYNAPQFVKGLEEPKEEYLEMKRLGYTFGGWYKDAACTDGNEYDFTGTLSDNLTIYAKWIVDETASYTVIIWKQSVQGGDKYDFEEAITLEGDTNTIIDTVAAVGEGDDAYATVDGDVKQYTGFHLKEFDEDVEIAPEGNAVLNVYFDRTEHTLVFLGAGNETVYTRTYNNNGTQYGIVNGQYVQLTRQGGYGNRYWTYNGTRYDGPRYVRNTGAKTITALYGQSIANNFPIDNQGSRWRDRDGVKYDYVLVYIDTMPDVDVIFEQSTSSASMKHLEIYVEALPGTTETTYEFNGKYYVKYGNTIDCRYNFFTKEEDFPDMLGFTANKDTDSYPAFGSSSERYVDNYNNTLKLYYTRQIFGILYRDGKYVDGNGNTIDETIRTKLKEETGIPYLADVSSYNKGGDDYYIPTADGDYSFEGWYVDPECQTPYTFDTMPLDGIIVYAKWRLNQYRVFLRPNDDDDGSMDWGSENQALNFRVSSGSGVSAPTGRRNDYVMMGWYDKNGKYFDAEVYRFTDSSDLLEDYDKTDPANYTDPMNKHGKGATWNSDVRDKDGNPIDRFWVTKKVELTARWRHITPGALGIDVKYDLTDPDLEVTGSGNVNDPAKYLDQAVAFAQPACTAPDGYKFECWVLQKWNGEAYEDIDNGDTYPGGEFTIDFNLAKATPVIDPETGEQAVDEEGTKQFEYTIQLRAKYVKNEEPKPTHINWYANNGTGDVVKTENVQINVGVDIMPADTFSYEGYVFIGWARLDADEQHEDPVALTEEDLFLKWDEEAGKFYAKDDNGEFTVEVTQVAADEKTPYHDLYAVWQSCFYVVRSSMPKAEANRITVPITPEMLEDDYEGYDLTQYVNTNTRLYGGYAVVLLDEDASSYVTADTKPYNGNNWTWTKMASADNGDAPGNAIKPVPGATYYIKEVPGALFLRAYTHYTYHITTGKLESLIMVSGIDDLNYAETGFIVTNDYAANVCQTMTVKTVNGEETIKVLKPSELFKLTDGSDYLTYKDTSEGGISGIFAKGENTIVQYWKTLDGLTVTGTVQRVLTVGDTAGSLSKVDSFVVSTIN